MLTFFSLRKISPIEACLAVLIIEVYQTGIDARLLFCPMQTYDHGVRNASAKIRDERIRGTEKLA